MEKPKVSVLCCGPRCYEVSDPCTPVHTIRPRRMLKMRKVGHLKNCMAHQCLSVVNLDRPECFRPMSRSGHAWCAGIPKAT